MHFYSAASTVYRNVFNTKKYVEVYSVENIQRDIGLKRAQMAELALLLGSDYTEGIPGVGIVNALEITSAFSGMDGLKTFRNWVENGDLPDQANRGIDVLQGRVCQKTCRSKRWRRRPFSVGQGKSHRFEGKRSWKYLPPTRNLQEKAPSHENKMDFTK